MTLGDTTMDSDLILVQAAGAAVADVIYGIPARRRGALATPPPPSSAATPAGDRGALAHVREALTSRVYGASEDQQ